MRLSKHDLFQTDDDWLKKLPAELLLEVSKRLLHDVKELHNRLNQNPGNSSRPPPTAGSGASARAHAARKRTPIAPKGFGKAARQATGQSGPWSHAETGRC
jgi:hypothetical protein